MKNFYKTGIFNKITSVLDIIEETISRLLVAHCFLFLGYLILNVIDYVIGKSYWILIDESFIISYLLINIGIKVLTSLAKVSKYIIKF